MKYKVGDILSTGNNTYEIVATYVNRKDSKDDPFHVALSQRGEYRTISAYTEASYSRVGGFEAGKRYSRNGHGETVYYCVTRDDDDDERFVLAFKLDFWHAVSVLDSDYGTLGYEEISEEQ